MIKKTTYEAQSQEEVDYIEGYPLLLNGLKNQIESLTGTIVSRDAEIVALKKEVADLKAIPTPTPTPTPTPVPTPVPSGDLLSSVNMTGVSISNPLTLWTSMKAFVASIFFNTQGAAQYTVIDIRKDPVDKVTDVMYLQTISDDPNVSSTTRAQMTQKFVDAFNPDVYHSSHRMYLHPDIEFLKNYPPDIGFLTIYEIWSDVIAGMGGSGTGACRWNLQLFKAKGAGNSLFWHVEFEKMQPNSSVQWKVDNKAVPIPYGKWFTLDIYLKRGEGANGRFKVTVDDTVIFDVANTTVYPGYPQVFVKEWQAFKLYSSPAVLDWLVANGKKFAAYYNDLKWFKS